MPVATAATVGAQLINAFKDPILKFSGKVKDKWLQIFNDGVIGYVDNFYEKFSKTKTFIYRDEKVNFYDVFFPVTVRNKQEIITDISDLKKLFDKKKYITIIGIAGSGKSMLMKHIFLSTISQLYSIPIVIELRGLNDFEGSLIDYIYKILTRNKIAISERVIEQLLEEGGYIFLLDGYDEIYSSSKNKLTEEIEEFVDSYNKNTFVITSRPGANAESLQRFDNYHVQPLDVNQIDKFIELQLKNHDTEEATKRILEVIKKPENIEYTEYLSNPLLLSMFIFTFNNYPELPKNKSKFYWNVFDTLCTKHDSITKKGAWLHERKSKLQNDELETVLKWFSYITLLKGHYSFEMDFLRQNLLEIKKKLQLNTNVDELIYDLTVSISILILDGTEITYPHKSLQEYFTASLIKDLTEDQKREVYGTKMKETFVHTQHGNTNFLKLCFELDRTSFCKLYLVPMGESFLNKINDSNDENLLKSFYRSLNLNITFKRTSTKTFLKWGHGYSNYAYLGFLHYFGINNFVPDFSKPSFMTSLELIVDILEEIGKKSTNSGIFQFSFSKNWGQGVEQFAKETGITEHVRSIIESVKMHLNSIKNDVSENILTTKKLLDL